MAKEVLEVQQDGTAIVVEDKKKAKLEKARKERLARLADIEDELLDDSAEILKGIHKFHEVDADTKEPPRAWVEELGIEGALKRLRVARAAWMGAKDAPVALKLASATATAVLKAKSTRDHKEAPRFNVAVVQLTAGPMPSFPELDVEK